MHKKWSFLTFFLLACWWALPAVGLAQTVTDPFEVFKAGAQLLSNADVEGTLAFWADDAVIQEIPPVNARNVSTYSGKQQIRQWTQALLDNHSYNPIENVEVNGDKLTFLSFMHNDVLAHGGIVVVNANQEWIVTGGKIKRVTITATPESVEILKKAGFNSIVTTQGQGASAAPAASVPVAPATVPASGFGLTSTGIGWLPLLPALVGLLSLCGISLRLVRRHNTR